MPSRARICTSALFETATLFPFTFADRIARQTRSGVAGFSISVTPSGARASTTAFTTAGGAAIVPASPMPFTPIGFVVEGVVVRQGRGLKTSQVLGELEPLLELKEDVRSLARLQAILDRTAER